MPRNRRANLKLYRTRSRRPV